jgi:hypothetical protein
MAFVLCLIVGKAVLGDESGVTEKSPGTGITIDLIPQGEVPVDRSDQLFHTADNDQPRLLTSVHWEAAGLVHQPLYFEDEAVERNGQYRPLLQPFMSAAHFFGRVPALPYLMAAQSPRSSVYSLGMTRPGSFVEPYYRQWPRSSTGGLTEAGVVAGLIFLIP